MKSNTKKVTLAAIMTAFALILSYIEMLLPPIWSAVPGVKMGLPNIVIIFLLYKLSVKYAFSVSFLRVFIISILFGNVLTLAYSTSGAVLSLGIMWLLKKTNLFSTIGVSIAGGVFHNLGQIITAIIILKTKEIGYYMIVLIPSGIIAGIFVGLAGALLIKYFKTNIKIY